MFNIEDVSDSMSTFGKLRNNRKKSKIYPYTLMILETGYDIKLSDTMSKHMSYTGS